MTTRWIVDVDGDKCAVAESDGESNRRVNEPTTREACEKLMQRLRSGDAARLHRTRVANGRRLARSAS